MGQASQSGCGYSVLTILEIGFNAGRFHYAKKPYCHKDIQGY